MTPLPIDALKPDLEMAWKRHRNFILEAPTGSGKSTRVPQLLLDWEGFPQGQTLLVLQPRRMAARLLARRVARERNEPLGQTIGYQVRFEAVKSETTRLLFVTEGLLLRRLTTGKGLEAIGGIIFDEFHERHLEGDVSLGLALEAQEAGWGGRIGICSATLEATDLEARIPDATALRGEGRTHPVEVRHVGGELGEPVWERAARAFKEAMREGAEGDILVFMPGRFEIDRTIRRLGELPEGRGWELLPLHGSLDAEAQDRAVERGNRPRIIVATNIAETSITLPGVKTVIDSGEARIPGYDPRRGVNTLLTGKISRASAEQRAGRAGRVAPGRCYRLWSRKDHEHREAHTTPEVERLDLTETRLQLTVLGRAKDFRWLTPPPEAVWARAGQLLEDLGAVKGGKVTETGRKMVEFPLHPRFSRIVLAAMERGCADLVLQAVSLLETRSVILPLRDRRKAEERERWWEQAEGFSDLLKPVFAWQRVREAGGDFGFCREWGIHGQALQQAGRIYQQLRRCLESGESGSREDPAAAFGKCLLAGYVDHLAMRSDRGTLRCHLVHGRRGELRRDSLVRDAALFVAAEVEEREFRGAVTLILGEATAIAEDWLEEVFPGEIQMVTEERLDPSRRRVERVRRTVFRDLVLDEKGAGEPEGARASEVLAAAIHESGWVLKNWNAEAESWIRRLNVVAAAFPEWEIKPIQEEDRRFLIEQICEGATAYKEVKDRPVLPVLKSWLPESMESLLEEMAPVRFDLPGGGRPKLRYEADGTVVLPARVQQLYDVPGTALRICQGRLPLRLEILAPNGRPVQITDDLDGFWQGQYPQIRKDLFGRYPKHEWR